MWLFSELNRSQLNEKSKVEREVKSQSRQQTMHKNYFKRMKVFSSLSKLN